MTNEKELFTQEELVQLAQQIYGSTIPSSLHHLMAFANAAGHAAITARDKELLAGVEPEVVAYGDRLRTPLQSAWVIPMTGVPPWMKVKEPLTTLDSYKQAIASAVLREREECAKEVDPSKFASNHDADLLKVVAENIRARSTE
jgi:hypothetical protein